MKLLVAVLSAMVVFGVTSTTAAAHLVITHNCEKNWYCIEKRQAKNLAHSLYVCNEGGRRHKRWSCKAVKEPGWLREEVAETQRALRPPETQVRIFHGTVYGNPLCGTACISCESGGDPQAENVGPTWRYWGLYQFDFETWKAHGGLGWEYGNAPAWRQHQVASRIAYDAWPNC